MWTVRNDDADRYLYLSRLCCCLAKTRDSTASAARRAPPSRVVVLKPQTLFTLHSHARQTRFRYINQGHCSLPSIPTFYILHPRSTSTPKHPTTLPHPHQQHHLINNVWQGQSWQVLRWQGRRLEQGAVALCEGGSSVPRWSYPPTPQAWQLRAACRCWCTR